MKDYWVTYTDRSEKSIITQYPQQKQEPIIGTCAQYLVSIGPAPSIRLEFRAAIADPAFLRLINGHKMQQIGLASGSVFCDAALTAALRTVEYSGRANISARCLALHDPELLAPLTRSLAGADGDLFTTASMESASTDIVSVKFRATSIQGESHDLGSITIKIDDPEKLQADWDRTSYYVETRALERIKLCQEGSGHRMQHEVVYALFANAVEFDPVFQGITEAYLSKDFQEAAATVSLKENPPSTSFTFSPYWGEALAHLAGFMVNGNPQKSSRTTFIVMGFESIKQTVEFEPGKKYLTYTCQSMGKRDSLLRRFCFRHRFS